MAPHQQPIGDTMIPVDMPAGCMKCPLGMGRTNIVVYRGTQGAPVLFVGEAPGATEDETGLPFQGRSGKLLDQWIYLMQMGSYDYCITNVARCRPPGNRKPTKAEMLECGPHLLKFIEDNNPSVIVALGRTADEFLHLAKVPHLFMKHPAYYLRGNKWEEDLLKLEFEIQQALHHG